MIVSLRRTDPQAVRVIGLSLALLAAMSIAAWVSWPLLVVLAVAGMVLTAYAAHRWPLATLVFATLAVLADPVLVPTALPDWIHLGPIGISEGLISVTGIVIAIDALRRDTFWPAFRDPVFYLGLAFVGAAVLSAIVNATQPRTALLGIVMTVDAIAVYFIARMVPLTLGSVARAIGAIVGVVAFASVIGILQVVLHPDLLGFASFAGRFGEGGRITSFLGNPNMVAAIVGFVLPFPLFASRHLSERRHRWIAFALLAGFCLALILTFSRGAWLAVLLGALIGILVLDWRALMTLGAAIALAYVVSMVMPRYLLIAEEDLPLYFPQGGGAPDIVNTVSDRLNAVYERRDLRMRFIREGIPIVLDNMALGVGPGRYGGAAASIIDTPVYEEYHTSLYGFRTVHNFWLHMLGEVGVIGTTIFLAIVAGLWLRIASAARRATESPLRFIVLAGTATAIGIVALNNMTEMIFEGNFPGFLIWMVVGLVSVLAPSGRIWQRDRLDAG
jgi:putative inorganic carbon (HCO3(-)) transporter